MYPMPEFQQGDFESILEFIRKYPLAILTGVGEGGKIVATHVPILVSGDGSRITLRGHVMRKTEYWNGFKSNPHVLVAFTGPDAPIPESWMERRPFGGTWNYMAVHVRGPLTFLPREELLKILHDLKESNEPDASFSFDQLPQEYLNALVPAIEGFEIVAEQVQGVFKLSQNRSRSEFENTIKQLTERGGESALLALEMAARRSAFFAE